MDRSPQICLAPKRQPLRGDAEARGGTGGKCSIALIDPAPMRRACVQRLLGNHIRNRTRGFADTGELLAESSVPDSGLRAVIFSIGPRPINDPAFLEWLPKLREALAFVPMIVLSDRDDFQHVVTAFRIGFHGYIPTTMEPSVAIKAIRMVLSGGRFFPASCLIEEGKQLALPRATPDAARETGREPMNRQDGEAPRRSEAKQSWNNWSPLRLAIWDRLREGKANKTIALELGIDESTVKSHVRQIMRQLGAENRTQIAIHSAGAPLEPAWDAPCERAGGGITPPRPH